MKKKRSDRGFLGLVRDPQRHEWKADDLRVMVVHDRDAVALWAYGEDGWTISLSAL